jgi:hypothetical protein
MPGDRLVHLFDDIHYAFDGIEGKTRCASDGTQITGHWGLPPETGS